MQDLKGRSALVTGGSYGIGPYTARALARAGMNVAVTARSDRTLGETAGDLRRLGVSAAAIVGDVMEPADRIRIVEEAEAAIGPLDVLVNNAAVLTFTALHTQSEEDIRRLIETNLVAPIMLTRLVLPGMLARRRGHIVNMSSLAAKKAIAYESVYAATKSGMAEWTEALRMELDGTGVSASAIFPTYVGQTGMFAVHGLRAPRLAGSTTAERVAAAVLKAIRQDRQEVIVRSTPTRPLLALNALSPELGTLIVKAMGVVSLNRSLAARHVPRDQPT